MDHREYYYPNGQVQQPAPAWGPLNNERSNGHVRTAHIAFVDVRWHATEKTAPARTWTQRPCHDEDPALAAPYEQESPRPEPDLGVDTPHLEYPSPCYVSPFKDVSYLKETCQLEAAVSREPSITSVATSLTPLNPPPAALAPPNTPAKGGVTAWLQVLGAAFLFVNTWGSVISFGVFQTYLQQNLLAGYTPSAISWIGTTQVFLLVIVGVISGPLYDMGYLQALLGTGTILTVGGYLAASYAAPGSYAAVFLSLGVCVGLGTGCLFTPSLGVSAAWFEPRRVPVAVGVSGMGSAVGGTVVPLVFRAVADAAGYAWAVRVVAFVSLATLAAALLLLKPAPPPPPAAATAGAPPRRGRSLLDRRALREPPFLLFTAAMFAFCTALYVPYYYLPQFAQARLGASEQTGFYLLAVQNAASFPGRLVPGLLAGSRFGALPTLLSAAAGTAVLVFAWPAVNSTAGLVAWLVLYGNFAGGVISLTAACVVALSSSSCSSGGPSVAGTRIGMTGAVYAFGLLIGNPIAGAIVRTRAGFTGQAIFAGVMLLVGLVLAALALLVHERIRVSLRVRFKMDRGQKLRDDMDVDSLYDTSGDGQA